MAKKAAAKTKRQTKTPATDQGERIRFTTYVPKTLADRFRDASYWLRIPLADLVEGALVREFARLEKEQGKIKPRERELSAGRALRT